jgi:hypothetical protein
MSSLPVPLSPWMSTLDNDGASVLMSARVSRMAWL